MAHSIVEFFTSLFQRFRHTSTDFPENREEFNAILKKAHENNLIDIDATSMIEGVLQVSEMQVRDIMIPRGQMDMIDIHEPPERFIPQIIETAHSRFPVFDDEKDNIIGILLAKDLLRYYHGEEFNIREMLRPAVFIPEAKRLNVLLKEFRSNRNHIAIVVDEYGGIAGLVTIEDVLEQIVGEIEDEFDMDDDEQMLIPEKELSGRYRVQAIMPIEDFNSALHVNLDPEDYDTVGGLVLHRFGRMPKPGEQVVIDNVRFQIIIANSRRIQTLLVEKITPQHSESEKE